MKPNILIIKKLRDFLYEKSQNDCETHRDSKDDFTRNRTLNFVAVVVFIVSLRKKSLSVSLDQFYQHFETPKKITKSAFSQARYKLKWEFFEDWSSELVKESSAYYRKTWRGFRIYGIDGSTLYLPNTKAMREEFGTHSNGKKVEVCMGRVMCSYDVLNGICHKSKVAPIKESELAIAYNWVQDFSSDSLCIYDRGFGSFALIYLHQLHSSEFVIRCKKGFNNVVKAFCKSNKKSAIVDFPINRRARKNLKEMGFDLETTATVKVRLLRIKLKTGEDEILITSLTNANKYPHKLFKDLYFLRWKTEVFFDRLKNKALMEVFSGHKPQAVKQEFHATIFVLNLQNLAIQETKPEVDIKTKHRKYPHKTNYNVSLGLIVDELARVFKEKGDFFWAWEDIKEICISKIEPVRADRTSVRKMGKKKKLKGRFHTTTNYRQAV